MKKLLKATQFIVVSIVVMLSIIRLANLSLLFFLSSVSASAQHNEGAIVVTVLEEGTLAPINNATICIIETKTYTYTNSKGLTGKIPVPILINQNYGASLSPPNGEVTILAYKSGFADSITFNVKIPTASTRIGFIIYLSPIYNASDTNPKITSELPNETWAKELIKNNKKF